MSLLERLPQALAGFAEAAAEAQPAGAAVSPCR